MTKDIKNISLVNTYNRYNSHRNGFTHTSFYSLMWDDEKGTHVEEFNHKVCYINRTWECYEYDTSRRCTLEDIIAWRKDVIKEELLEDNGKKRMTKALKPIWEELCENDPIIKVVKEEKSTIK